MCRKLKVKARDMRPCEYEFSCTLPSFRDQRLNRNIGYETPDGPLRYDLSRPHAVNYPPKKEDNTDPDTMSVEEFLHKALGKRMKPGKWEADKATGMKN